MAQKYLNFVNKTGAPRQFMGFKTGVLVITEDILSAQKCVEAGYSAFPLLTTTAKEIDLMYLTGEFNCGTIVVWNDNDNIDVKRKRNKLEETISLLSISRVKSIKDYKDPKYYTTEQIKEIINE